MKKRKKSETLIYCGPSFPGELQQFSIFRGGIPKHVNKHMEACPSIEKLFVETSKLAETRTKLNIAGKKENQLFNNILQYQKEAK
ncbi:hypothetical protein [Gracilibacillus xinjiangensis]|uniref:Uncharacterized protein n=1 Tax=Gracilibacillus xinjiangensis TaxID=1193282 RepID=A0ABV8WWA4_9BACI